MEFESLSILHLSKHLLNFVNSPQQSEEPKKIGTHNENSDTIQNPEEYSYQDELKLDGHDERYSLKHNNTSHYTLFSSSLMAAYSSGSNGDDTPSWDVVTDQPDIMEMEVTNSTLTPAAEAVFDEIPLRHSTWGIVILIIGYLLVFIFGIVGNCSVVVVVLRVRRMKTVTNFFIFSLAVADLLVLLFCLLPNLVSNIFVPWVLGWFLCKTVPYIQGLSVCASVYFLVAISVERCLGIQWPYKYQVTKEKAKLTITAIWLWSGLVALPWALFFRVGAFDPDNPHLEFCVEDWPENYKDWSTYYFLFGNLFICYIFPLVLILVCYVTISLRVYRRSVPSNCYQKAMELIHQRSKTVVIKMLMVVVLTFALSYLPIFAIIIRLKFGKDPGETESFLISLTYPFAQWLVCFNSCINPVIYSFLNVKFRKAFLSIIKSDRKRDRIKFKHKSPTVNILLKRLSTIQYRVETTMSNNDDSSESI